MKFSKTILNSFIKLPTDWQDLMEDVGIEIKSFDNDIMNLELLANRGDHYCYDGIAREISGRTGQKLETRDQRPETRDSELFEIQTDKCIAYSLLPLKKTTNHKSQITDYAKILSASGVNVIQDIIDITNVVMLERGQPGHVYDADKIVGKMRIRETVAGERAQLLFHDGWTELPAGTTVISDDEKILCVAGVIGCIGAGVDENTTNILYETALFEPKSIRHASKQIGHSSIASQIFERGGNIDESRGLSFGRALELYNEIGWIQSGDAQYSENLTMYPKREYIKMNGDYIRDSLEINMSDDEIEERLARYGFKKTEFGYKVPSWRIWDIHGEKADLAEEICRSIGYDALPSKLPPVVMGGEKNTAEKRTDVINNVLINNGFFQVLTDNMYSPKHANVFPNMEHVSVENSIDGAYAYMKASNMPQAVELISKNLRVFNTEIRAYEWGAIFEDKGQVPVLWGITHGIKTNVLDIKKLMENIFDAIGVEIKFEFNSKDLLDEEEMLMPKRRARILSKKDDIFLGYFGELSPVILDYFDIKNAKNPCCFSLNTNAILNILEQEKQFVSPPTIIPSTRDISVVVPYGKPAGDVVNEIMKKYPVISKVEIKDVFDKPSDKTRNITLTLTFNGEHSSDTLNKLIVDIK